MTYRSIRLCLAACILTMSAGLARAADPQVERGKYLVQYGGCGDCHTPGYFFGHPDTTRTLGGSDIGFAVPGLGVFVPPNLTPDKETGLGKWTVPQIVAAVTKGERPDGRILAPIMPWRDFATLSHADALAVAAYLKSLPPVKHAVPGPVGPADKPLLPVMVIVPPDVYAGLPKH